MSDPCHSPALHTSRGHHSCISYFWTEAQVSVSPVTEVGTAILTVAVSFELQEALARQHAMSAVSSSQAPADFNHRPASPWDSAWDQQSAAARDPSQGHQRPLHSQRQHNQGAFGSIVSDYRPAPRLSPLQNCCDGVARSHRYDR